MLANNRTCPVGSYKQSKLKITRLKGRYSAVLSSQLSWAWEQYKKCVQYDFKFTSVYSEKNTPTILLLKYPWYAPEPLLRSSLSVIVPKMHKCLRKKGAFYFIIMRTIYILLNFQGNKFAVKCSSSANKKVSKCLPRTVYIV